MKPKEKIGKKGSRKALLDLVSDGTSVVSPATLLPASDYFDLAGEEFGRRLLLTQGADGATYCLRPDFTLPIVRQHIVSGTTRPAAYGYLGPIFRQRASGPCEFEQAGLELIGFDDAGQTLCRVFDFVRDGLAAFDVSEPAVRIGCVALFEELLEKLEMPGVWRPRLHRRFGDRRAMEALLQRLLRLQDDNGQGQDARAPRTREQLIQDITGRMLEDGLSLVEGRTPRDIAERYLEKQALAAARVPRQTIELLGKYLTIAAPPETALARARALFAEAGLSLQTPLARLESHIGAFRERFPGASVELDLGFSPRLHYYTGLVFELVGTGGNVLASGGQYDRLLQALGARGRVSAAGCALWVDRLEGEGA